MVDQLLRLADAQICALCACAKEEISIVAISIDHCELTEAGKTLYVVALYMLGHETCMVALKGTAGGMPQCYTSPEMCRAKFENTSVVLKGSRLTSAADCQAVVHSLR